MKCNILLRWITTVWQCRCEFLPHSLSQDLPKQQIPTDNALSVAFPVQSTEAAIDNLYSVCRHVFVIQTVSQPHNNFNRHWDGQTTQDPQFVLSLLASEEPALSSSSMASQKLSSSSQASKSTSPRRLQKSGRHRQTERWHFSTNFRIKHVIAELVLREQILPICFSESIHSIYSLSHTHTHTHTRARTGIRWQQQQLPDYTCV